MNFLRYLYWSLYKARDREQSIYEWFVGVKNNHLVVQGICTACYAPRAYKFLWRLQGNMPNYNLIER
jgi:hypothetical protein